LAAIADAPDFRGSDLHQYRRSTDFWELKPYQLSKGSGMSDFGELQPGSGAESE
jgi:hypothetical protein